MRILLRQLSELKCVIYFKKCLERKQNQKFPELLMGKTIHIYTVCMCVCIHVYVCVCIYMLYKYVCILYRYIYTHKESEKDLTL